MDDEKLVRWAAEFIGWRLLTFKEAGRDCISPEKAWFSIDGELEDGEPSYQFESWEENLEETLPVTTDLNHTKLIIEKMRELGWLISLEGLAKEYEVCFCKQDPNSPDDVFVANQNWVKDANLCLAILKAAKVAMGGSDDQ